jgi:hypothetical protein
MNSSLPQELSEKFSRIILLRSNEILVSVLNTSRILFEVMLKDIPKSGMEWWFRSALIDLYTAMANGIKSGAFVVTNERLIFLRRTMEREGVTIWKSHHYEIEESVNLRDIISVKVKEDILEVIHRDRAEASVLYFAAFNEMDPKQPGYESLPRTVSTGEVAREINEYRRVTR